MFCGKCGKKIDVPSGYAEPTINCPNCNNILKVLQKANTSPKSTLGNNPPTIKEENIVQEQPTDNKPITTEKLSAAIINPVTTDNKLNTAENEPIAAGNNSAITENKPIAVANNPDATENKPNDTENKAKRVENKPNISDVKIITAGKLQLGSNCSICNKPINIGDKIYICNFCKSTNHENCWLQNNGCPVKECAGKLSPEERAARTQTKLVKPSKNPEDIIACKWCKEPMKRGDVTCPHCGKVQSSDSLSEDDNSYYQFDDSPPLSKRDYFFIFVTPLIGYKMQNWPMFFIFLAIMPIFGIILIKSGETLKGKKILKTSIIYDGFVVLPIVLPILIAIISQLTK